MKKIYVLYNPKAGNNTGENESKKITMVSDYEVVYRDITSMDNYSEFFGALNESDSVIVAGGDGTLSYFADSICDVEIKNPVYYYAAGSGNDFFKDLNLKKGDGPVLLNSYIENLPVMTVNGRECRFVNGVGGGLDAYSCNAGNMLHKKGKKANYVLSAIKGILYDYKPMNAIVTVDGKKREFKNVWFASVMKGRYFGGGIMLAPKQDRCLEKLSAVIVHKAGRFRLLTIIPGAFEGKHVKYTEYVEIMEGSSISVEFDRPVPVQIDGETMSGVKNYGVEMKKKVSSK